MSEQARERETQPGQMSTPIPQIPQKPSLGRIVICRIPEFYRGNNNGEPIAPAIITHIWSDTCVNLRVACDGELVLWLTSVNYEEPDSGLNSDRGWYWPPRV